MSVAYVIMCDADCGETAPAAPSLAGYRARLTRQGWASLGRAPHGSDYCPKHAHLAEDDAGESL